MIEVVGAIRYVRVQVGPGICRMNALALLPLEDSMAQCGAGKQDPCQGYMTILVINEGNLKSISILTVVMHPMI